MGVCPSMPFFGGNKVSRIVAGTRSSHTFSSDTPTSGTFLGALIARVLMGFIRIVRSESGRLYESYMGVSTNQLIGRTPAAGNIMPRVSYYGAEM